MLPKGTVPAGRQEESSNLFWSMTRLVEILPKGCLRSGIHSVPTWKEVGPDTVGTE
ncbi:MAG: hypothetical protein HY961_19430 [Ignavibacteriae bacterium]|nr:hypothetical protein [Ignavibacteriota bacterium]